MSNGVNAFKNGFEVSKSLSAFNRFCLFVFVFVVSFVGDLFGDFDFFDGVLLLIFIDCKSIIVDLVNAA